MTVTVPGPTLGVVGGGQLGRMLAEAAAPLGVEVVVLDPTPDCPAAPVARDQIVGGFDDPEAFRELASRADALTFEIELADSELLDDVSEAHGLSVHPSPETLSLIEDKLVQKRALEDAGVPVPPFRRVDDAEDLRAALEEFGSVMLKARTGGYDGRGNVPVREESEIEDALDAVGGPAMAETFVDFARELSVIAAQGDGEVRTFPVGENVHEEEILRETVVPARTDESTLARADEVARGVLSVLDGRGVFGIEMFETDGGEISVNEIAPRPHNSGHWTIEGARTSQFEQHVRAVLGWPLGSPARRSPTAMANVLGTVEESQEAELGGVESVLAADGASLHWYGKDEVRPLRKMGHLTLTGTDGASDDDADVDELLARARDLRDGLRFE
ncbi:phosphoribosylaminoimidazole carboxylase, ATPase subunit [Halogeometricum pallidum JCM 14848]|uniref:N5-carboxyaminoimidazole ribonucleotide synthase n=1 Tax=Halogeometricum pallidum JCM 14848 TaxID=1227487 RepID=M0CW00_HALPD|nr:5-(carboxyamino)imidazole ribonucleotide synthase [Halogeometricum pallidum]ELZ26607.1 phosphoribosylaminoimidazole carboxylase, ATPase subunit [Halogeometricum pallidum JCM 14848]